MVVTPVHREGRVSVVDHVAATRQIATLLARMTLPRTTATTDKSFRRGGVRRERVVVYELASSALELSQGGLHETHGVRAHGCSERSRFGYGIAEHDG
jgi:hypothetical protein